MGIGRVMLVPLFLALGGAPACSPQKPAPKIAQRQTSITLTRAAADRYGVPKSVDLSTPNNALLAALAKHFGVEVEALVVLNRDAEGNWRQTEKLAGGALFALGGEAGVLILPATKPVSVATKTPIPVKAEPAKPQVRTMTPEELDQACRDNGYIGVDEMLQMTDFGPPPKPELIAPTLKVLKGHVPFERVKAPRRTVKQDVSILATDANKVADGKKAAPFNASSKATVVDGEGNAVAGIAVELRNQGESYLHVRVRVNPKKLDAGKQTVFLQVTTQVGGEKIVARYPFEVEGKKKRGPGKTAQKGGRRRVQAKRTAGTRKAEKSRKPEEPKAGKRVDLFKKAREALKKAGQE